MSENEIQIYEKCLNMRRMFLSSTNWHFKKALFEWLLRTSHDWSFFIYFHVLRS